MASLTIHQNKKSYSSTTLSPHIRHWLSLIHVTPFIFHHLSSQSSALVIGTTTTLASS